MCIFNSPSNDAKPTEVPAASEDSDMDSDVELDMEGMQNSQLDISKDFHKVGNLPKYPSNIITIRPLKKSCVAMWEVDFFGWALFIIAS